MSGEKVAEEFEPFTMITQEEGGIAGLAGHFKSGKEWVQGKHSGVRPWAEFLNVRHISKPKSSGEVVSRVLGNLSRFQSNYLFVFLGLVVYCIVTNPTLLFALAFCLAVWWLISVKNKGETIRIMGRETSAREVYVVVGVVLIPILYFAGAGSTVFWIIGASVVLVLVHSVLLALPERNGDAELGMVLEDVIVS